MYHDILDPTTGQLVTSASQVELKVAAGLVSLGISPALSLRIAQVGAKPLTDGNLLFELVQKGFVTPLTAVDLLSAPVGRGRSTFTAVQLQKKFKHAGDFAVTGTATKANLSLFETALLSHAFDPMVLMIAGTYVKKPAKFLIHPDTNLAIIVDRLHNFLTGWRLSPQQMVFGMILGRLGAHP